MSYAGHRLTSAEWAGGDVWLLVITWDGRPYRFATRAVEVTTADGDVLPFAGGLDIDPELRADIADNGAEDSIPIDSLLFPVSVAAEDRAGRPLVGASAELSVWSTSRTYEERELVISGTVGAARFGGIDAPVSIDLEPASMEEGALIPSPGAVVTETGWPNAASTALGLSYPLVFGRPGLGATVDEKSRGGAPALLVDTTSNGVWLVSDGRVAAANGTSAAAFIVNTADGSSEAATVTQTTDGNGRLCAIVTGAGGGSPVTVDDAATYWLDWSTTDGGIVKDDGNDAAETAGDVALWLLARSSAKIDRGRWEAAADSLTGYRFAFYFDEPAAPLDRVVDLFAALPVSIGTGPGGVSPTVVNLEAREVDAVTHIEEGRNVDPADGGLVTVDRGDIVNELRVSYGPRADNGEMQHAFTLTGDLNATGATIVPACVASHSVHGSRVESLELPYVYESATALRIAHSVLRARALAPRVTTWADRTGGLGWLQAGDVVTLTSSRLSYTSQVAHVIGRRPLSQTIEIAVYPSLSRDSRT